MSLRHLVGPLEPLGFEGDGLDSWLAPTQSQQAARLAPHLHAELAGVTQAELDTDYLRSDAFRANVAQALRAAEIAPSDTKLRLIARGLVGCLLRYPAPQPDKFQTMRLIEMISDREFGVLAALLASLDPFDPYAQLISQAPHLPGFSREETEAALLGLAGLGLLHAVTPGWQLSALTRQLARVARLEPAFE